MTARRFVRVDKLGSIILYPGSAYRTILEPMVGILLTLGLICTLVLW